MKKIKNSLFYIAITGGFTAIMYWIIFKGKDLELGKKFPVVGSGNGHWEDFQTSMLSNLHHPLAILLAQIVTIIIVARFFQYPVSFKYELANKIASA